MIRPAQTIVKSPSKIIMPDYPIFLLPKGEIMVTASTEDEQIKVLKKTLFPSGKRYAISKSGMAACIDGEKKLIIYGQINDRGGFDYAKVIPFPELICPKSLCIIDNNLVLGGEYDHDFFNEESSYELVISFSLLNEKFIVAELPFMEDGKSIDDFLVDGHTVIAVDDLIYPKYLIEYDFGDPNQPFLVKSYDLPANGTYEIISKGSLNDGYIALLSSSSGSEGEGRFINIFKKGYYDQYIRLSLWYERWLGNDDKNDTIKKYFWRDIYLVPKQNILLISAETDGIGIYRINTKFMIQADSDYIEDHNDAKHIYYLNAWNKDLIKILKVPNEEEKVILIFEEGNPDAVQHSYVIAHIDDILSKIPGEFI